MKICYIVGAYPLMKCGVGDYTKKLVNEIKNKNVDVSVITSSSASNADNVYNCIDKWNIFSINKILKILKEIKPDIVHIQYPSNEYKKNIMINILPFFIKKYIKCKIVHTFHEYSIASKLGKIRIKISNSFSDHSIVVEKKYKKEMLEEKIEKKERKITYIPIYSNIPKSECRIDKINEIQDKYNIKESIVLSYFGFIVESKGFEDLLEVLKRVNKYIEKDVCLLVIGKLNLKNKYHISINNMINEMQLNKNIIFTDFIDSSEEVADILQSTKVCVLPFVDGVSEKNGSFLAAYNQNIKVVTTSDKELIENGIYYAKKDDIESLFNMVIKAIKSNENITRKCKEITDIIDLHLNVYSEVLKNEEICN